MGQFVADGLPKRPITTRVIFTARGHNGRYYDITLTTQIDNAHQASSYYSSMKDSFINSLDEHVFGHLNVIFGSRVIARKYGKG